MIWQPAAVYGFVRAARFRAEQWAPAVALALATSGGNDAFRDCPEPGRVVDRRGLFGIDVVARPELAGRDLFDPRTSAQVAYALTTGAEGTFDWSTVPVPAVDDPIYQTAMAAVRAGRTTQKVGNGAESAATAPAGSPLARMAEIGQYLQQQATGSV